VQQRDLLANSDGDYGRQRHQQQFLRAVLAKTTSTGVVVNPLTLNAVLDSLGKAVSFYDNNVDIVDWIFTLKGISADDVVMIRTNAGAFNSSTINGISYETLSPDSMQMLTDVAADNVESFVRTHPTWLSPSGESGTQ
jgi:anionic cell wall polymer biosynthesis LytR-Cps2A-Psr (LCP) family protein